MSIRIEFDDPKCEYYSGTVMSGNIYVELKEPKYIRKIAIKIKGKIKNRWKERHNNSEGIQDIFTHKMSFIEKPQKFELQPGRYKYHFEYLLPEKLPVNWFGIYGCIRYTVKAFIDIPLGFDISRKEEFKIIPVVDLNLLEYARKSFLMNIHKPLGISCCPSGSVTLNVTAPKNGFICSETIPFLVDIENNSDSEVYNTKICITKKILYLSTTPKTRKRKECFTLVSDLWPTKIPPHGGQQTFHTPLQLKLTEPSTIDDNLIIKIFYELKVTSIISGFNSNISAKCRIIIGNVPFNN